MRCVNNKAKGTGDKCLMFDSMTVLVHTSFSTLPGAKERQEGRRKRKEERRRAWRKDVERCNNLRKHAVPYNCCFLLKDS